VARAKADVLAHLVAGAPAHLKFVDQQHVAPLFRWQGGLLRQRHLEETQQDDADQFREVGPDHAARGKRCFTTPRSPWLHLKSLLAKRRRKNYQFIDSPVLTMNHNLAVKKGRSSILFRLIDR